MKIIITKLIAILYSATHICIFKNLSRYWTITRNIVYSKWISQKFKNNNICFRYPINQIKLPQYFKIGNGTVFGKYVVLTAWDKHNGFRFSPKIKIGENCKFGEYLHLTCINKIEIGNNVLTGRWVTISDNGHGNTDLNSLKTPPLERDWVSKGNISIENNVWIGDKATILAGVTIGEGSVIAANAVVTKDVPPYSVVAGNPSKVIKHSS